MQKAPAAPGSRAERPGLPFTKMQGIGNDFVLLDADTLPPETDLSALALRLCTHHTAIGADGLLVVSRLAPASLVLRMFNSDGTPDVCGNGMRCAALWAARRGWIDRREAFVIQAGDGPHTGRILETAPDDRSGLVRVDLARPRLHPDHIPFCGTGEPQVVDWPLPVGDRTFRITAVNTGSTHTVIFGPAIDEDTFARYSPLLEIHPYFPERTSVLWATPGAGSRIDIRIWERGVGETWGCGTGACAVAVAARLQGLASSDEWTAVVSRGGVLEIRWPAPDAPVEMVGPGAIVFEGDVPVVA